MGEAPRIEDQLKRAFEGKSWLGPTIPEILEGITAEQASARPLADAQSIWALVLHIAAWLETTQRRLEGEPWRVLSPAEDWPDVVERSDEAWSAALQRLDFAQCSLRTTVSGLTDAQLDEQIQGSDYTFYVHLHGVIQHTVYHLGQVSLLKRA